MKYGICLSAQIPVRESRSERAEMVTQMLFGETCKIIDLKNDWYFIYTDTDQYLGWCDSKSVTIISKDEYLAIEEEKHPCISSAFAQLAINNELITISQGSTLPLLKDQNFKVNNRTYSIKTGAIDIEDSAAQLATNLLGSPYLWGGRTIMGIDCSGLIVNIFKILGIYLPRDASEQIAYGETVAFLNEAQTDDVCFFDNQDGKITHVGILIDNKTIIHASGKVRIDRIDHQGIYNEELKKYTHHLRIIKRLIP
jgi:hypothetical protein